MLLNNKKALITGIASNRSIAYGIAKKLSENGAELCLTYQNDNLYGSKSKRSPMITCYLKRKSISLKKPKQFSGSMDTLDLGYRENIRYKKRIWGWMELPCDMEINW